MKTPQLSYPQLAQAIGLTNEVWLKREDLHNYGSHKGRSIPFMISEYAKQGITNFIISSSGNAALSATQAVQTHNRNKKSILSLTILVGEHVDTNKHTQLKNFSSDQNIKIKQVARPKQTAFQLEKSGHGKWLRQSTDDTALLGYQELAQELSKIPNLAAVFIPTSSGTTAQGLFEGFQKLGINPQIHIVQTDSCHSIAQELQATSYKLQATHSLASAIVDRIAHRKEMVAAAVKASAGHGWIATNTEIIQAQELIKKTAGLDISPNSALSIVGLTQAIKSGLNWNGPVVCLITGR